jgi:hypothetical protein
MLSASRTKLSRSAAIPHDFCAESAIVILHLMCGGTGHSDIQSTLDEWIAAFELGRMGPPKVARKKKSGGFKKTAGISFGEKGKVSLKVRQRNCPVLIPAHY